MDAQVSRQLKQVIRRARLARRLQNLSWLWSLLALVAALAWSIAPAGLSGEHVAGMLLAVGLLGTLWTLRPRSMSARETHDVAAAIEVRFPDLQQRLLTAIEQKPNADTGHFSWLQNVLAAEVRSHSYVYDWRKARPLSGLLLRGAMALCAVVAASWLAAQLWDIEPTVVADASPTAEPDSPEAGTRFQLSVDPGNAEVERGSSLLILARFEGLLPAEVALNRTTADGESSLPMAKALDDPLFGIRLPSVTSDFEYTVRYDDESSESFRIAVYELPRVEQIDATVGFPSYANLPTETIEDTWQVAAVEGSNVLLTCRLNKAIADGALFSDHGDEFPLTAIETGTSPTALQSTSDSAAAPSTSGYRYAARIPVQRSLRLRFALQDDRGRESRDEDEFRIDALPNKPPEIKLTFPARDLRVSPVEELQLEANVWDDFGLRELGLELAVADQPTKTITLAEKAAGREMHQLAHLIQLELEAAEPDQLVSYYFFADDFDSAGNPRRTMSDMFFAEVRHFEEIFREGRQPPAGQQQQQQQQGQNAQQAEQLAELQKQIMNATWKIIRRETRDEVSAAFAEDTGLLIESQQEALTKLQELAEQVQDPVSKGHVTNIAKAMTSATERLTISRADADAGVLDEALRQERSAYQGLLKLRAREHEVTQQQSQQSQGQKSQQNRSQQQLDQLELDNKKNRYEAERQAQQQESQQQQNQEQLQVLNRLRELARRQGDLNQKLRELELALKAAGDKQEHEEIERQLKRLREEQRELLRDVDELRNRMEQTENQQQLAEENRKLDETRDRVRQASEALEQGQVSQALNAGTRAERELEQIRDDVRQKAAGQFSDEMRDLRQQAREIGERQDQIAQQLNGDEKKEAGARPSLRSEQKREDLRDEFRDQRKQVEQVVERMREVVEKAETAEPLLARQLYETVRQARSDRTDEALQQADQLLQRGLVKEAAEAEDFAHKGVERMQRGIEQAAESVLGNELETLRRASRELADARDAIAQELGENGEGPRTEGRDPNADGQQAQSGGEQPKSDAQKGQNPPGQPRREGSQDGQQPGRDSEQRGEQSPTPSQQQGQQGQEGQRSGQKPGESPNGQLSPQQGQQSPNGQPQDGQKPNGQQPGQPSGQQPGQRPGEGQQPNGQSPSSQQQPGQPSNSQQPGQQSGQQPGQQPGSRQRPGLRNSQQPQQQEGSGGLRTESGEHNSQGGAPTPAAPLTGGDFVQWSDQLRNIEELVDDPKLRAEVARIREAARNMRVEFKRHSKDPEWSLVQMQILEPLNELRQQLQEEIARRESPDSLVPIDRDPIPEKYSDLVRQYYERIGAGRVLTPESSSEE